MGPLRIQRLDLYPGSSRWFVVDQTTGSLVDGPFWTESTAEQRLATIRRDGA